MSDFLNKDYGLNDYNMPVLPYRLSGSDEYTNRDIVNLSSHTIENLKTIFTNNSKETEVLKVETLGKQYRIEERKIVETPPVMSDYLKVEIYKVIDSGKIVIDDNLHIFELNDTRYGVSLNLQRTSRFYICEDYDGVLKYLNDIGFKI